jgi:hypothetical protein
MCSVALESLPYLKRYCPCSDYSWIVAWNCIDKRIILYRKRLGTRPGLYVFRYRVGGITVRSQSAQNIRDTGQTASSETSYTGPYLPLHRRRTYHYWFFKVKCQVVLDLGRIDVRKMACAESDWIACTRNFSGVGVPRLHIMTAVMSTAIKECVLTNINLRTLRLQNSRAVKKCSNFIICII